MEPVGDVFRQLGVSSLSVSPLVEGFVAVTEMLLAQ